MFAGRFSSSVGPIGIDFGSQGVKMVQLRENAGRLHVVGAARVDVPPVRVPNPRLQRENGTAPGTRAGESSESFVSTVNPAELAALSQQIRAAFTEGGFVGRKCAISLAREDVSLQAVRLPKMPDHELRQSAVWEASQRCNLDRTAIQVDFIRTGATLQNGDNKEEIILVAAPHAAIHARLDPLLDAGLRPVAVEPGFSALVRTFSRRVRRESDQATVRAIVEVGQSGSSVLILRGDQIAFCKPISISGSTFNAAVAEHLQIEARAAAELRSARIAAVVVGSEDTPGTDAATDRAVFEAVRPFMGELIKEVTLCLRYYGVTFRGHPPEQIILTGGDGLEPRLGETMAKMCKTPVVFDDADLTLAGLIGEIRTSMNRTPGPASSWAIAVGLAMRGLDRRARETADATTSTTRSAA